MWVLTYTDSNISSGLKSNQIDLDVLWYAQEGDLPNLFAILNDELMEAQYLIEGVPGMIFVSANITKKKRQQP
jgi:hypothetical protein